MEIAERGHSIIDHSKKRFKKMEMLSVPAIITKQNSPQRHLHSYRREHYRLGEELRIGEPKIAIEEA